ncbi:Ser/Thr phosphatase family protein [[Eubacterium] yurii subsp. margaretiae ATCC 43715]|nr:Ser/Thr phosphatase family protein [[Eubacterium] yurii subsp. margaretiae ATCC 43715]
MNIFAIGDLHLSNSLPEKSMEKFGWINHQQKIFENWEQNVEDEDIVLLVGDISWAMKLEDAFVDLAEIAKMKGQKILIKGNHDFWWQSINKIKNYDEHMFFMQNNVYEIEDYVICGTRGWLCPNRIKFDEQDEKMYKREVLRLERELIEASKYNKKIILLLHFPPTNDEKQESDFTRLIKKYNVKTVIYGHLHGQESFNLSYNGMIGDVNYHLVSADYLDFKLKKIEIEK